MSVAGILSSAVFSIGSQLLQSRKQQIRQEFQQLGTDLQSGNLTAAQSDFAALQQDFQSQGTQTHHHHHHHGGGSNNSGSSSGGSEISQLFSQLGSALQSGNLSTAQQAYASMLQQFQQYGASGVAASQTATSALSVNA